MLRRKKILTKELINKIKKNLTSVELRANDNDRGIYEVLTKEFPVVSDLVLIHDIEGVGIAFCPSNGNFKWRTLTEIYQDFLPLIVEKREKEAYEIILKEYIGNGAS